MYGSSEGSGESTHLRHIEISTKILLSGPYIPRYLLLYQQVNPALSEKFEEKGMMFVGRSEDGERMEIMELKGRFPYI